MPVPLDEYPLHQVALPAGRPATSDRNFYDRWYFNAHDRTGRLLLVTGMGYYPHLGVKDAYLCVRVGDVQRVVRASGGLALAGAEDRLRPEVGPSRIEVTEPLHRVRVSWDTDDQGLAADLHWQGSFPAVDEGSHLLLAGDRPIVDTWRFAQVGTWTGTILLDGEEITVDPEHWVGTRDRSWGIRPVGEPEPAGRPPDDSSRFGFWWLYVPLRFERFALVLIAQEDGDGHRSLNSAVRVLPDGRVEQLGWPRVRIAYRAGSRHPESAVIGLTEPDGSPLTLEVDTLTAVPLHLGCGYGGDSDWLHGQWRGQDWLEGATYDLTDPTVAGRIPFGVIDHVARGRIGNDVGWGLFEHGTIGRHDPSGFRDLGSVAA